MKKTLSILLLLLAITSTYAQEMTGTWYGTLDTKGSKLRIVFHVSKTGDAYTTTMDSPDQGVSGIATDKTTIQGKQLTISAAEFGLTYTGSYVPDSSKITGTFTQGTGNFPLTLSKKTATAVTVIRPQDPKDFPYKQEEVTFVNVKNGNQLAGTLTMPSNGKASKIAILISGSGPQNRNEELAPFNHRPFLVWSDWLTRNGIAVLRYDDRGIGKSTGNFAKASSADFADDAEAAVNYISSRADLKHLSIGLVGHSEGGMIAPMVASRNKSVKFIVLLAGTGVPIAELMVQQNQDLMRLSGAPASTIALSAATNTKIYQAMNQYKNLPFDAFKAKIDTLMYDEFRTHQKELLLGQDVNKVVGTLSKTFYTPWFRYFISFNPAVYLSKVKCPVLALNGTLDMQIKSDTNLAAIQTVLQKAGNTRFDIMPLPGLNHLFQQATTGGTVEYGQISETVNPKVLQKVSAWIAEVALRPSAQ
ncbi:alpha/beta hydrolase family protein [Pedobacter heparinus]|uniref:alpha/beta hydrolase family protein n=1 Tax=Pedobacter heparinus TaxID=984 RepID=UPI00292E7F3F|nr:alpha/beta fold hydrolase [Pedobacter heparinus]